MANRTIRDIERQANRQAGVEPKYDAFTRSVQQNESDFEELTFSSIANTLAHRYDSIYYVNLNNDHYVEYTSSAEYRDLKVEISGDDFFADSARNIKRVVHPEDQAFALAVHDKNYILAELEKENILSFTYRIMFDDVAHYYNGRITRGSEDDRDHLIIGWANVDSEVRRERDFAAAAHENRLTKNINQALISDYVRVFYVDLADDGFLEFTPDAKSAEFTVSRRGEAFFEDTQAQVADMIYHEDQARFAAVFIKENLLSLMDDTPFIITYRSQRNGRPEWHTLKALYADNRTHMLIAVRNIDVQKRREAEYESRLTTMSQMVNRDSMTSVKNKNAFSQEERRWNQLLSAGSAEPFAVAVCDLNDLKRVNDTQGHKAGDKLIIQAAKLISDIFKHSPVFRIGGDEFAVILSGRDYANRSSLMGELEDRVRRNRAEGGPVIASGMTAFDEKSDNRFEDVFRRADEEMYAHKRELKG